MDKTTLISERKLFLYTVLSLVGLRIVITLFFYLTYEMAAFLTLLTKGIVFYLVYRLASVLNKPSWQKLLYAILSVFAVYYLIPFIALLVEINKKIKMEDDDIGSMSYDVNDPYELKKLKRNLNYKSLDYLHNLVLWFVRNDSKITDFEKNFEDEKILYLSQEIHQDLNQISKKEEFLDVLLKSIAYQKLALINIANIYESNKTAFERKKYEDIPEEDQELFYKMSQVNTYYEAKSRILGWIYNNTYNVSFDPCLYKTRIEELMEEILEEELNVPYDFAKDLKDYYEILEVSKNASDEIIKKAYKTLVVRYHPDTTTMIDKEEANKIFLNIQEDYEVLKDEKKRRSYDKVYDKNKNMSSSINEESPNESINKEANITIANEDYLTAEEQIKIAVEKKPSKSKKLFVITALAIIALLIYSSDLIKNPNYLSETASQNTENLTISLENSFNNDSFFIYDHEVEMVLKGDFEYPVLLE